MDITLIIGDSDQGKSTLVRCLTGKSRDMHDHPSIKNIVRLGWLSGGGTPIIVETLTLISSLNEGNKYSKTGTKNYQNLGGTVAIHPNDLEDMLDDYGKTKKSPAKAILCISNSVKNSGWQFYDYCRAMRTSSFVAKHTIANTVYVGSVGATATLPNANNFPGPNVPANCVANQARPHIGLV